MKKCLRCRVEQDDSEYTPQRSYKTLATCKTCRDYHRSYQHGSFVGKELKHELSKYDLSAQCLVATMVKDSLKNKGNI